MRAELRRLLVVGCAVSAAWFASRARPAEAATTIQIPEGTRPVTVVQKGIICGPLTGGWSLESDRRSVRAPAPDAPNLARVLPVKVADDASACASTKNAILLVATGPWPSIDPGSVVFHPDDGRIELRGERIKGLQVLWPAKQDGKDGAEATAPREDSDACLDPQPTGNLQMCTVPVHAGLPTDVPLRWLPAYARPDADLTFDGEGAVVNLADLALRPARIVLTKPLFLGKGVDISQGPGRIPLSHPKAVAQVDCGQARCELAEGAVVVRSVPGPATQVAVRARLAPRVVVQRGDAFETQVTATLPLLTCPMSVASGPPLREIDNVRLAVRLEGSCGKEPRALRFMVAGEEADIVRVARAGDVSFVVLQVSRLVSGRVTVSAYRGDIDTTTVASTTVETVNAPRPRATLELQGFGKIDFVPTNRPALVQVAPPGPKARFIPVPVEGAYTVEHKDGAYFARGEENAGGFASLAFAYRSLAMPAEVGPVDLAVIVENVQRAVREASVPAAIGTSAYGEEPIVEVLCADEAGKDVQVPPSKPFEVSMRTRETCRVVVHRERLDAEDGMQEVLIEVDVTKADGTPRAEARASERMVLRPGGESRIVAIKGGIDQFDRITVRVSHVADESRYVLSPTQRAGLPSVQWSMIVRGGHVRLYATAAIPAGLYRVNEPGGQLTLNFGVLSRLTWLDRTGKEGLLGFEVGVMGMGLIPRRGDVEFPPTLAIVAGLGLRVPLGGGAAINVQGWFAREFRDDIKVRGMDNVSRPVDYSRWSFVFGPSISIGNVGMNL